MVAFHDADTDTDILARMSATGITSIARVGRVGEDPRADVRVGVGVVEFQLIARVLTLGCRAAVGETAAHVF